VNVLDRRLDPELLAAAASAGRRVYARSVLLQGTLVADPSSLPSPVQRLGPYIDRFQRLAGACGRTPAELALGWVRSLPGITGVVVGVELVEDLRTLVSAFQAPQLRPGELRAVADLELPDPKWCDPRTWASS
jgi:aryl-alcohol dehydrogenase-like predicted oxidoreductase